MSTPTTNPDPAVDIRIYQIFFRDDQRGLLEPEFIPFDNSGHESHFLELDVFHRIYDQGLVDDAQMWGALSWKFRQKADMTGAELLDYIRQNPGYDVYFMNPHVQIDGLFENLWVQGASSHPEFIRVVSVLCDHMRINKDFLSDVRSSELFSTANYLVGNRKFWSGYLAFMKKFEDAIQGDLPEALAKILSSKAADPRGHHAGANYIPFIMERLCTEYLHVMQTSLKFHKIPLLRKRRELPPQMRDLEFLKQKAIDTRSPQFHQAWANYRTLVLDKMSRAASDHRGGQ